MFFEWNGKRTNSWCGKMQMDKASIVGDAVLYVKELQVQAKKLKAEISVLESSINETQTSHRGQNHKKIVQTSHSGQFLPCKIIQVHFKL